MRWTILLAVCALAQWGTDSPGTSQNPVPGIDTTSVETTQDITTSVETTQDITTTEEESEDLDVAPTAVWVFIALYMVLLLLIALWAWWEERKSDTEATIEDHYVAGKGLGPIALTLTLFASAWSGYTITGAPAEAYRDGWNALRWIPGSIIVQTAILFVCPRIQWLAHMRDYRSTVDFITDRYRSHALSVMVAICQFLPTVLYVMGQFKAMGNTMYGLSGGNIPAIYSAGGLAVLMLIYEYFGGMKAVAYTDVAQGVILLAGFILFYVVQDTVFGGVGKTTDELEYCADSDISCLDPNYISGHCCSIINYAAGEDEDETLMSADTAKELLGISSEEKLGWLNFIIAGLSFPIYPHILIRYYVAKDVNTLKTGMQVLHFSPFIAALPSIALGVALIHYGLKLEDSTAVFGTSMTELVEENTFYYIMGSAILAAAVAAYMSTADSGLLAISSIVTLDFVQPFCWVNHPWTDMGLLKVGKVTSIVAAAIGVLMVPWDITLSDLFILQGTLLFQAFPVFVLGLYWKRASSRGMTITMVVGIATLIACFVLEMTDNSTLDISPAIWTAIAQAAVIIIYYFILGLDKEVWDPLERNQWGRFEAMHKSYIGMDISEAGGPATEPCRPLWLNLVALSLCFIAIPFWTDTSYDKTTFHYGFPEWGFITLACCVVSMLISMYQTHFMWQDALSNTSVYNNLGDSGYYSQMIDSQIEQDTGFLTRIQNSLFSAKTSYDFGDEPNRKTTSGSSEMVVYGTKTNVFD